MYFGLPVLNALIRVSERFWGGNAVSSAYSHYTHYLFNPKLSGRSGSIQLIHFMLVFLQSEICEQSLGAFRSFTLDTDTLQCVIPARSP